MPNCFYRISAKALSINDKGEILVCIEKNGKVDLPGGGIEPGESPIQALKREVNEEMGVEVQVLEENPSYFLTCRLYFESLKKECNFANVIYKTRFNDLNITKSDECQKAVYLSISKLKKMDCNSNLKELLTKL